MSEYIWILTIVAVFFVRCALRWLSMIAMVARCILCEICAEAIEHACWNLSYWSIVGALRGMILVCLTELESIMEIVLCVKL